MSRVKSFSVILHYRYLIDLITKLLTGIKIWKKIQPIFLDLVAIWLHQSYPFCSFWSTDLIDEQHHNDIKQDIIKLFTLMKTMLWIICTSNKTSNNGVYKLCMYVSLTFISISTLKLRNPFFNDVSFGKKIPKLKSLFENFEFQ